jgi:hypothetical protein
MELKMSPAKCLELEKLDYVNPVFIGFLRLDLETCLAEIDRLRSALVTILTENKCYRRLGCPHCAAATALDWGT